MPRRDLSRGGVGHIPFSSIQFRIPCSTPSRFCLTSPAVNRSTRTPSLSNRPTPIADRWPARFAHIQTQPVGLGQGITGRWPADASTLKPSPLDWTKESRTVGPHESSTLKPSPLGWAKESRRWPARFVHIETQPVGLGKGIADRWPARFVHIETQPVGLGQGITGRWPADASPHRTSRSTKN